MRLQRSSAARSALLRVLVGVWVATALLLTQCQAARVNDATGSGARSLFDTNSNTVLNNGDQGSPETKTLRVEASPVVQLQLRSQDSHDAANIKGDFDDSDDAYGWDDDIFDDDSDSDSDDDMLSFLNPHPEPQATKLYEFTLGRRWYVYPATEQEVAHWAFQIAVSLPGQAFVHILKDDPDYKDERNRYKHGDNLAPIAKIVAESNDSVLLNDLNVFETAQGWFVSSVQDVAGTPTTRRIDDLVVRVYLNRKEYKSQQLKSLVSTGAGDVIVHKKVLPRSALSLQIASRGNGSIFLQSSSSLSYTSLIFETTGNSSLYARLSGSLSVGASMYLTVDGMSSIDIDADRISASMVTATTTDTAEICVSANRLSVGATLNATVVGDGSIAMFADHGQSSMETIVIDGSGKVDTSTVSSINTDVAIHGGSASAKVQSVFRLSYDVSPGSHVRYRGRSPMALTRTTGSPPLEKLESSSTSAKCRAVVIPDEPKAGRFPPLESLDSQSPDAPVYLTSSPKMTAVSPSSIFTTGESLTTPEVDEAIDKANDKVARAEAKAEAATSKAADIMKTLTPGIGFGGPWQNLYPPASASVPTTAPTPTLAPTPVPTWQPTPAPIPPTTVIPVAMQEPTAAPISTPTPSNASTPTMTATTSTTADASKWKIEDIYFQLAAGFIAFIWLLHQLLYCCDRCSRRRSYESIQGGDDDPPVVV